MCFFMAVMLQKSGALLWGCRYVSHSLQPERGPNERCSSAPSYSDSCQNISETRRLTGNIAQRAWNLGIVDVVSQKECWVQLNALLACPHLDED